jgi:hypothetical protein
LYSRTNNTKNYFFYILSIFLITAVIYVLVIGKFDYLLLFLIALLPVEIFLYPREIKISESELFINEVHLLGFIRKNKRILLANIQSINALSNFSGAETSSDEDGSFMVFPGSGSPPFALYQITYRNNYREVDRLSLNLYPNEFNILREKIKASR